MADAPKSMLSVDVEDWFHVDNLKGAISRESWSQRELRVDRNVDTVLSRLEETSTKGTFFILGWVAERRPELIKRIKSAGHEIAAHGYGHELVYELTPEEFRRDVARAKDILEDLVGEQVVGYRAPNFSITDWAIEILIELGFRYDSSLFPILAHDRYGRLSHVATPHGGYYELKNRFYEVALSYLSVLHQKIPWSGGAYFRMIPYPIFKRGVQSILHETGAYCFYVHPWEFDPGQPRIPNIKMFYKFRHYQNLRKTESRFAQLLRDFTFRPIRTALPL